MLAALTLGDTTPGRTWGPWREGKRELTTPGLNYLRQEDSGKLLPEERTPLAEQMHIQMWGGLERVHSSWNGVGKKS